MLQMWKQTSRGNMRSQTHLLHMVISETLRKGDHKEVYIVGDWTQWQYHETLKKI